MSIVGPQTSVEVTIPSILKNIATRLAEVADGKKKQSKYRRLSETILTMIEDGILEPGDRLPTETAFAENLPFSLGTIQKALRTLSELGVIKRTPGSGTVIAERTHEIFDLWQFRFIDDNENSVFPVFSQVIKLDRIRQKGAWSRFLGNEESYVRIVREIDVDHRFRAISYFYLSDSQFGAIVDLSPADLEGVHLSAIIQREFGITTVHTKNRVVCSVIPDHICLRLNLPSAARGLICQILGFGPNDLPLSFQQAYIPADVEPMEFRELKPTWTSSQG